MTANQIEYWKLQETRRHNVATEQMDKPVKESQTAYNYASINLLQEQAATQETVRAMNLAAAAASYASAENQYAQASLNEERRVTEQYQQQYIEQQSQYVNAETQHEWARTYGQNLSNEYQQYVNQYAPYNLNYEFKVNQFNATKAEDMRSAWMSDADQYAQFSVFTEATGLNGGAIVSGATKVFNTIYSN